MSVPRTDQSKRDDFPNRCSGGELYESTPSLENDETGRTEDRVHEIPSGQRPHAAMSADAPPRRGQHVPPAPLPPPPHYTTSIKSPTPLPPRPREHAACARDRAALSLPRGPAGSLVPHVGDVLRWGAPSSASVGRRSHRGVEEQFRSRHTHIYTRAQAQPHSVSTFELQRIRPGKEKKITLPSARERERSGRTGGGVQEGEVGGGAADRVAPCSSGLRRTSGGGIRAPMRR